MTIRAERLNASFEAGAARLRRRADAAEMTAQATEALADSLARDKREAEEDRNAARADLVRLRAEADTSKQLSDRRWKARIGYLVIGVIAVIALFQRDPIWLGATAIGSLVFWNAAMQWTTDVSAQWTRLLPSIAIEGVGLLLALR